MEENDKRGKIKAMSETETNLALSEAAAANIVNVCY